jgi:hypothetical protein
MYAGASAPEAARRVVRNRIWRPPRSGATATASTDDNNNGEETTDSPQLTLGDQHPRAHIIMFVLGVLPQAIKLFGMCEIPWTQACGGLYLSLFLVIAGVGALARYAEGDTDADTSQAGAGLVENTMEVWNIVVAVVAAVVQARVWVWCLRALLRPVWDMKANAPVLYSILWTTAWTGFTPIIWMPTGISLLLPLKTFYMPPTLRKIAYFASLSLSFLCVCCTIRFMILLYTVDYIAFLVYVLLVAFWATQLVPHHLLMIFFGLVNLVVSILYYRFRYDPTGTVKPLWAEKLG